MKKTFSLKLMLLGLMAFGSTSVWAQYTAVDGVVYGDADLTKKEAKVVGVLKGERLLDPMVTTTKAVKSIQIADEVTIKGVTCKVVDFAANWMHAGEFKNDPVQGSTSTTPATNPGLDDGSDWDTTGGSGGSNPTGRVVYRTVEVATVAGYDADQNVNPLELIIRASKMTEISRSDIEIDETGTILPIAAFIIGSDCGIKDIPANMFAGSKGKTTTTDVYYGGTNTEAASREKLAADKAAADAALNGTYVINNGKYNGKPAYQRVYPEGGDWAGFYVVLGEANGEKDADGNDLFTVLKLNEDGTTSECGLSGWVHGDDGAPIARFFGEDMKQIATQVAADLCWGSTGGAVGELEKAKAEKKAADEKVADAQEALDIAKLKEKYPEMFSTEDVAKKAAAERLEAAIAAFAKNEAPQKGYWTALKKKVQAYTNVTEISPWFAGYTLATEGVAAVGVGATYWQPLVDELKDAYAAFYGKDITTVELNPVGNPVEGHAIEWIWVTGDVVEGNEFVESGVGVDLTDVDEDESGNFYLAPIPTAISEQIPDVDLDDYQMLREIVIAGDVSLEDAKFVKVEDIDGDLYYVVYVYDEDEEALVPFCVEGNSDKSYAVVKIDPESQEFQVYTPKPAAELDIDACDPAGDIAEAKKGVMTVDEATEALNTALAEQAAAQEKLTAAQTKKDNAQARVDELADVDPTAHTSTSVTVPEFDATKENKTLELAAFNNYDKVETIGANAFFNCVNAEFTGTFHAVLKNIGTKAFANTKFKNLNLNNTNTVLDRNDDKKMNDADRLGDDAIADDAFLNTPMETMLLANTNLSDDKIKAIARNIKFEEKKYTDDCGDEYTRTVNETLNTVELPTATAELDGIDALECVKVLDRTFENCVALPAIAFPAQIDAIEDNAFCGDDALATITFAPENSELLWIGNGAFYHAAATTIDLSAQKKLGYQMPGNIGDYAFADMKNLTSVNLTNTKLKTLPANIFDGDAKLATVTFYDAADPKSGSFIETLPAGLFKTNAIAVLDIAKTKITVLENLFQAGNGFQKGKDCNGNEITLNPFNETLTAVKLPAWLKAIATNALAHMHNPAFTTVEVPGSVEELGEGVFGDDKYLEVVSFFNYQNDPAKKDFLDGSMLDELSPKTFAQCPNLKQVYIVTYETLDNDYFGDNCFFSAGTSNTAEDPRVEVYVNYDSYNALRGVPTVFSSTYSKLMAYTTTLKGTKIGDEYFKPWTSKFGTWIEAVDEGENAVGVYTAYQDGHKIILYPAKKSTFEGKSYYKIAAYDDDRAKAALGFPSFQPTRDLTNTTIQPSWNGFYYESLAELTEGLEVFTPFPAIGFDWSSEFPGGQQPVLTDGTPIYESPNGGYYTYKDGEIREVVYRDGNYYYYDDGRLIIIDDPVLISNTNAGIPWQIKEILEERVSFGSMGAWGNFNPSTDVLAKTWMALGTAIIVYSNPDGVPYIQKTNEDQKYQSTLDLANQLSVTWKDEPKDDDNNWYYLAKSGDKPKFKHHDTDDNIEFIPRGSVAFLQTTQQGKGAREFDIEIVDVNEATAIGGVMDYIGAKNSDAIYNLQGVRVTNTVKGQMYIKGGKKFIQK